ncbi:uncharacterized protein LOC110847284 isoform X1 [Folsomia candida]|uniref:uncharacterized protein LOC110847284 isoform X1 n=1 Tax=Folsomia candida TaxID=158441 RepID=UPI000B8FF298|nr:uncharacterized protein LOC110847284 isoform X1 [Folsomia candida]XP_035706149.1 uncharacterized protein LOC110847284 isoform X1 [Folsomia candida]
MEAFRSFPLFVAILTATMVTRVNCDLTHMIESPKITNWGAWGSLESCPVGAFVVGMQLKVEKADGWKDDSGLNGIRLFCSRLGSSIDIYEESPVVISSSVGPYGEWKQIFRCGDKDLNPKTSAVVGFSIKVEDPRGVHDDTSANNFRIFCKDLEDDTGDNNNNKSDTEEEARPQQHLTVEGDGTSWGKWTDSQLCRNGYAICGIATQVDHGHGEGKGYDDTALNNVRAECCRIRFHSLYEELDLPRKNDDVIFPDPIESARELQKSIIEMQQITPRNQKTDLHQNPHATPDGNDASHNDRLIITVPQVLTVDHSTTTEVPISPLDEAELMSRTKSENSNQLSQELSHLANLDFSHPELTTHFKIASDPDGTFPEHNDGVTTIDEIAAKPIVPPEVVHYIESDIKDEDADPDLIHIKVIAGSINTTTTKSPQPPPTGNRNAIDTENDDGDTIHNPLLVASNANKPLYSTCFIIILCTFLV